MVAWTHATHAEAWSRSLGSIIDACALCQGTAGRGLAYLCGEVQAFPLSVGSVAAASFSCPGASAGTCKKYLGSEGPSPHRLMAYLLINRGEFMVIIINYHHSRLCRKGQVNTRRNEPPPGPAAHPVGNEKIN